MKDFFLHQFQYDYRCNQQLIESYYDKGFDISPRIRALICHNLNVHHIWNSRILGATPASFDWDDLPFHSWEKLNDQNRLQTIAILQSFDLKSEVQYTTDTGLVSVKPIYLLLSHILNHSTHHRGQINILLQQNALTPINCNLIDFIDKY